MTMNQKQLLNLLRMPPEQWKNNSIEVEIRHGAYKEAAQKIESLENALDAAMQRMFSLDEFMSDVACLIAEGSEIMTSKQIVEHIKDRLIDSGETRV